jgi:hypothetical protein
MGASPSCAQNLDCKATTEVWETAAYAVIRDRKMCGCAPDFVHGLVIPRAWIRGMHLLNICNILRIPLKYPAKIVA